MGEDGTSTERLREYTDLLLRRDVEAHAAGIVGLAAEGDERVIPHLVELVVVDAIANDWEQFGFPEVLRDRAPPRYLELPDVRWPGVRDALATLAEPSFDAEYAWVEWESWYSQQDVEPLAGFDEWKLRLYRSFLPPVGSLLAATPRSFALQDIRWGNCDRSFLAALNAPEFVPAGHIADAREGRESGSIHGDDTVFGFTVEGTSYAVPRRILFPHELLNARFGGVPLSLTFCTLCNAPILYDRRVGDRTLTFGSSGLLLRGNKVMYDEETETLWDQHVGKPIAGERYEHDPDLVLDTLPVTQTAWDDWLAEHPDTRVLTEETGYGYDYGYYDGDLGIFRHYWENEDVTQPGVRRVDGHLPEKTAVYGVVGEEGATAWVVPVADVPSDEVLTAVVEGQEVVVATDPTGDVAVYESPPGPVEYGTDGLVDATGDTWTVERSGLSNEGTGETLRRVPGRHGLWFAFRTHYDDVHLLTDGDANPTREPGGAG